MSNIVNENKSKENMSKDKDDVPTKRTQSLTEEHINHRYEAFLLPDDVTGWKRVKSTLFTPDDNGDFSPHVKMISSSTMVAAFSGVAYGGFKESCAAFTDFMRTNQATKFDSQMEAKRRLQDRVTVGYIKGGVRLGWRTGIFTFMFLGVSNVISVYRNKDGILEYIAGGLAAGMSYRLHVGTRGVIVGGILGSALGTIAGLTNTALLKISGVSMTQLREALYKNQLYDDCLMAEAIAEANREEDSDKNLLLERFKLEKQGNIFPKNLENID